MRGEDLVDRLVELLQPPPWYRRAACRGSQLDFVPSTRGGNVTAQKAVCAACSVREQCLAAALSHADYQGIWGGLSQRERERARVLGATVDELLDGPRSVREKSARFPKPR